jgi:hypothetical protein
MERQAQISGEFHDGERCMLSAGGPRSPACEALPRYKTCPRFSTGPLKTKTVCRFHSSAFTRGTAVPSTPKQTNATISRLLISEFCCCLLPGLSILLTQIERPAHRSLQAEEPPGARLSSMTIDRHLALTSVTCSQWPDRLPRLFSSRRRENSGKVRSTASEVPQH